MTEIRRHRVTEAGAVHDEREIEAIVDVLRTTTLDLGARVEEFERRIAELLAHEHGVMVNSGTSACWLAVDLLGCEPAQRPHRGENHRAKPADDRRRVHSIRRQQPHASRHLHAFDQPVEGVLPFGGHDRLTRAPQGRRRDESHEQPQGTHGRAGEPRHHNHRHCLLPGIGDR